jgi:uncharacterized membrane protein
LRIRLGDGLWLANILSWLLIIVILLLPDNPVRVVLGTPFVLFYPGYALITALIPGKTGLSGIERVVLSLGLSIALVVLVGLGLNYTFGIGLESILYTVAVLLFLLSAVAWLRRRRLPANERLSLTVELSTQAVWSGRPLEKVLSIVLVVAILGSLGTVGYAIARPKTAQQFTEFYILGPDGSAENYPSQVTLGDTPSVTAGIVNYHDESVSYEILVSVNGTEVSRVGPIPLDSGEKWEGEVSFVPQMAGANQKVEFTLREDPQVDVPQSLRLWIDVTD